MELYFQDLSVAAQKELLKTSGITDPTQANWDTFPIATIELEESTRWDESAAYIRIFQISAAKDNDRRMFGNSVLLRKKGDECGKASVDLSIYDLVWSGYMKADSLESIYDFFNGESRPSAKKMRSMAVSDIVEISDSPDGVLDGMWFVDSIGWKRISNRFYLEGTEYSI